jgi:hypothetical protein
LNSDLEEAEDQYQMALRTHLVNLDSLIKLHDSRLYALERNFHQELRVLQADFNKEKTTIVGKFKQEKKELSAIIEGIENEEENRDADVSQLFLNKFCLRLNFMLGGRAYQRPASRRIVYFPYFDVYKSLFLWLLG